MTQAQFREECSKLALQTFRSMGSAKFYILISSSFFFWIDKLDQSSWLSAVLTVAGLTQASSIAEILRGAKRDEVTTAEPIGFVEQVTQTKTGLSVKGRLSRKS